jgi:hypothetical protein
VHFLWTMRDKKVFFTRRLGKLRPRGCASAFARRFACLPRASIYNSSRSQKARTRRRPPVTSDVHRFEESIAGRLYQIEVKSVSADRWRAYIVRIPGVPTALMPFYGRTPCEAAHLLCEWLTQAHGRTANSAGSV